MFIIAPEVYPSHHVDMSSCVLPSINTNLQVNLQEPPVAPDLQGAAESEHCQITALSHLPSSLFRFDQSSRIKLESCFDFASGFLLIDR